jgi:hypothetical protein
MKVKFCGFIALLFALLLMIGSCSNAGLDGDSGDTGNNSNSNGFDDEDEEYADEGDDNDSTKPLTAQNFRLDAVKGLSTSSEDVNLGGVVGTLRVPEREGPWTVELVDDLHHNHLFAVNSVDSTDGEEGFDFWKVTIAEGPLEWGIYWISLRIFNNDSKEYFKVIQFEVAITPAPFKKAPTVFPYIVSKGKNKLAVSWSAPSGSEGYRLYVGTDPNTRPAAPNKTVAGAGTTTAEITDIEDDETDGGLPDGTLYYVWVEAYNSAGGSFSPVGRRRTSATVQPYWYENTQVHDCLYGDRYYFTETTIEYAFGSSGNNASGFNYIGDILYHEKTTSSGVGKHDIDYTGKDAGVFIIKYQSPAVSKYVPDYEKKLYSAVFYWGMDTCMTTVHPKYPVYGDIPEAFVVNQWANYAERQSFEEAIDFFTWGKASDFIHVSPEPYAKFEVGDEKAPSW